MAWSTRVASFALVHHAGSWLLLRHRRLRVLRWELPGGHLECGETAEDAAARETLEETGVPVQVGALVATCVHEWAEHRQRRIILFFAAEPVGAQRPRSVLEPQISEVTWQVPTRIDRGVMSAFLHPLVEAWPDIIEPGFSPLAYRAEHWMDEDGRWHPRII